MTTVISQNSRSEVEKMLRQLPAILTGRAADPHGIARGLKARIAWAFFSLVFPAFNEKGRGKTDSAGESWEPLSQSYLAYQRGTAGPGKPRAGGLAPGGNDGFMSQADLAQWRKDYARSLAWLAKRMDVEAAKGIAAATAWKNYKDRGGETKWDTFGKRQAGSDYQTLVDHGTLRRSLTIGILTESGVDANYASPASQINQVQPASVVLGTSVPYAKYHHLGKGKRKRRFWPERLPSDWWNQILEVARGGLLQIGQLAAEGRLK